MVHLGLFCPAETGHLNTMLPLGQEMHRRGHRVTFFGIVDAKSKVLAAGLEFRSIGEAEFPAGASDRLFEELGKLSGVAALLYTMDWIKQSAIVFLKEGPNVLKDAQIEAILVDQISPEGGIVAEFLDIPFITICSALPFNQEPTIPPLFTTWKYNPSWWAVLRNQLVYQLVNPFTRSIKKLRSDYRKSWKLPPEISADSQLAILTQQPAEFEYPRKSLPDYFHFTGPYHNQTSRKPVDFPWEQLTDKPLIYASMGTLQNQLTDVFKAIAEACVGLDAQLVISLGGASLESLPALPGNPIVVSYAPQLALLERAAVAITHAGMNTALECLTYGVPMVAIPVTNDQPGVAARIAWTGAGEIVPFNKLTATRLQTALNLVLTEPSYQENALRLKRSISEAGGVNRAADIIELAISTRQPVNRA
ncbi:glycosyltransferase [Chamaesiphon sp. VAR_48_metabat_135_sub]|uniref:glycosyltransferase n=1 Tax=Chamaesiphon sp. VAR_48_metabat_135_sub TaxID=2964699 RepID=UPI00286D4ED1|nr:glycosyltransferase [Chamaesiphon sp. VAR_48_metabat_135_sub]